MTITMTAYIALLIAALFDLFIMLRCDILILQQTNFDNSDYNKRLGDMGEFTSTKRLLVLAVLIGVFTTMARMSWIVVLILAAIILAQAIGLARRSIGKGLTLSKQAVRLLVTSIVLTLLVVELAGHLGSIKSEENACHDAAIVTLMCIAVTPLIVMASNWLLRPIERRLNKKQ